MNNKVQINIGDYTISFINNKNSICDKDYIRFLRFITKNNRILYK